MLGGRVSLIVGQLDGAATVVDEVHGFKYFDERDLLGFVDGTENTTGSAAEEAVTMEPKTRRSPAEATSSSRSTCTTWTTGMP